MGGDTTNTVNANQRIVNSVLQASKQKCDAKCQNLISGITIIAGPGTGDINIKQECKLTNISCIMRTQLNSQIENILDAMVKQTATQAGLFPAWGDASNTMNLYQQIENSITQTMDSACLFEASSTVTGAYFYVVGERNVNLSQSGIITNASCNMDNLAKAVTYNEISADVDQTATVSSIFTLIAIVVIICIVVAGIVAITFILTGGVSTLATAANKAVDKGADTIAAHPELAALL